jgi:hypothetical protein
MIEISMLDAGSTDGTDLATLVAAIARSPIVLARRAAPAPRLPLGYDGVDVAVLDWIAAEGRRIGRSLARM